MTTELFRIIACIIYIFFFLLTHSSRVNVSIFLDSMYNKVFFSFFSVLLLLDQGVIVEEGTPLNSYY